MAYVFISYQRSASTTLAHLLKEKLEGASFSVYLDVESQQEIGPLQPQIMQEIEDCTVFLCLLEQTTLSSPWVRQEIERAISAGKLCLPVLHERFAFPADAAGAARTLLEMAGERIYDRSNVFFKEGIARIVERVQGARLAALTPRPDAALRVLVVEDSDYWVPKIRGALVKSVKNLSLTEARTAADAALLLFEPFDLIIMDMDLGDSQGYRAGQTLSETLRSQKRPLPTGLLILSNLADPDAIAGTYEQLRPTFLSKMNFTDETLRDRAATAVRSERLHLADEWARRPSFLFQFGVGGLELGGVSDNLLRVHNHTPFDAAQYGGRFDLFMGQTASGIDDPMLRALGNDIGAALLHDPALRDQFQILRHDSAFRIAFAANSIVQTAPFEIVRFGEQFTAARTPIIRRWRATNPVNSLNASFIRDLTRDRQPLEVMLIGSPESEEIHAIRSIIEHHLIVQGILNSIQVYKDVQSYADYLNSVGRKCHMLHITQPAANEASPMLLARVATVLREKSCHFVFALTGLTNTTWTWVDKLAQAGVGGIVTSQRPVSQHFSASFATHFYHHFFTTWDVGQGVRQARLPFFETDLHAFLPICIEVRSL